MSLLVSAAVIGTWCCGW